MTSRETTRAVKSWTDSVARFARFAQSCLYFALYLALYFALTLSLINLYCLYRDDRSLFSLNGQSTLNFETGALLCLLAAHYFPRIRSLRVRFLVPLALPLVLYSSFDQFMLNFARSPRLSDLSNVVMMIDSVPELFIGLIALMMLAVSSTLYLAYAHLRDTPRPQRSRARLYLFLRVVCVALLSWVLTSERFIEAHTARYQYIPWKELTNIKENGRLSSFLFYSYQERIHQRKLERYRRADVDACRELYASQEPALLKTSLPNIHLIVLESWVDPRLFESFKYTPSPLAAELRPYLLKGEARSVGNAGNTEGPSLSALLGLSLVKSPIYGGGTAQAEFELLTGLPALSKVNSIEFNVMRGRPTLSLVRQLCDQRGYTFFATVGSGSKYFNTREAYQSLGLDQVVFLEESPEFELNPKDFYIFDGDVFEAHLERLKSRLESQLERQLKARQGTRRGDQPSGERRPIMSYILGMYGHKSFNRNLTARPDVVRVEPHHDTVHRIANQFYYRTQALGRHLAWLAQHDPTAIVYVTSDHLPGVLSDEVRYLRDRKENISILRVGDQAIDISGRAHHEIPRLIWSGLSSGWSVGVDPTPMSPAERERCYFQLISRSVFE